MGVHLTSVHLMGVYLMGVYLTGVHLMNVVMNADRGRQCELLEIKKSRNALIGEWASTPTARRAV